MATGTDEILQSLNKSLAELRQIRDEIRVKLHLANLEAKERWTALEPRLAEAEKHVREAGEAARNAVGEIVKAFRAFSSNLPPS